MIQFQCEESLAPVQIEINFALCKIGWQREYEDRKCIFWRSRIGGAPWNILPITKGGVCHWPRASLTRSPICTPPSFPFSSTFIHFHPSSPIFIHCHPFLSMFIHSHFPLPATICKFIHYYVFLLIICFPIFTNIMASILRLIGGCYQLLPVLCHKWPTLRASMCSQPG